MRPWLMGTRLRRARSSGPLHQPAEVGVGGSECMRPDMGNRCALADVHLDLAADRAPPVASGVVLAELLPEAFATARRLRREHGVEKVHGLYHVTRIVRVGKPELLAVVRGHALEARAVDDGEP